jgi:hypothetical protein
MRPGGSKRANCILIGDTYLYGELGIKLILAAKILSKEKGTLVRVTSLGVDGVKSYFLTLEDLWTM